MPDGFWMAPSGGAPPSRRSSSRLSAAKSRRRRGSPSDFRVATACKSRPLRVVRVHLRPDDAARSFSIGQPPCLGSAKTLSETAHPKEGGALPPTGGNDPGKGALRHLIAVHRPLLDLPI